MAEDPAAADGVAAFDGLDRLPDAALALLAAGAQADFQLGAGWFAAVAAAALPDGARPLFLLYREAGRALALLPLQRCNGRLAGLSTPYTTYWRPLTAADATPAELHRAGAAFGRACRGAGPLRLDALDADWPGLAPLLAGLRVSGLVALRFAHFASWHTPLPADWPAYLAARPGELRETIRRRLAQAARTPSIACEVIEGGAALESGIAAYEQVYASSWKPPEPFPGFTAVLLPQAAGAGALRLGVLRRAGVPIAAQYWVLAGTPGARTATVLKLAHDEAARAVSPGTVLTALMIRRLIEQDGVTALDFGRGDDPYKAGWTGLRRERIGVLLCPPRHPAGLAALLRHAAGRLARRLARTA